MNVGPTKVDLPLPAPVVKVILLGSATKEAMEASHEGICAAISPENLHSETDWGSAQGIEEW